MGLDWVPDQILESIALERVMEPKVSAEEEVREELKSRALAAAKSIAYLSIHSPTERVRLEASKYIIDQVIGKPGISTEPAKDIITDFINGITEYTAAH